MPVLLNCQLTRLRKLYIINFLARSRMGQSMLERMQRARQEFLDPSSRRSKRWQAARRNVRLKTVNLMAVPMWHSTSSSRWLRLKVPIRHNRMRPIRLFIMKGRRRIYLCSLRTWHKAEILLWASLIRGMELIRWERLDIEVLLEGMAFIETLSHINLSLMRSNRSSLKNFFHHQEMITELSYPCQGPHHAQTGSGESPCLLKPKISWRETWIGQS
jgi:hypothetical protein